MPDPIYSGGQHPLAGLAAIDRRPPVFSAGASRDIVRSLPTVGAFGTSYAGGHFVQMERKTRRPKDTHRIERSTREALAIIAAERAAREAKTTRLRQLRLASCQFASEMK